MPIEALERVLLRVRRLEPNEDKILYSTLRKAIIKEIGYDERTYKLISKALRRMGWIRTWSSKKCFLTNNDLKEA